MADPRDGGFRSGPAATGIGLAVLSAGTFGMSGIFASALISAGWSPAAAAIARLGGAALLLAAPAMVQLRGRWALLRREAGKVVIYGLVAVAGGQLFYFNAIESIPIGLAVLLEYLGVVLVVGWLWAVRGQRPGRLTVAGVVTAIAGLALLVGMAGSARVSTAGIMWGLLEAVSLGAKLASFTGMAEVFFAALYAWLLLGQLPSPTEFTGGALMLSGVILVRVDEKLHRPRSYLSGRPAHYQRRVRTRRG